MFNESINRTIENIYSLFNAPQKHSFTNDHHLFATLFTAS